MLAPSLLKQSIPVLVGTSNFMVATCNFSIMYFYPMWFQTVMLTSASVAGECSLLSFIAALFLRSFVPQLYLSIYLSIPQTDADSTLILLVIRYEC